MKYLFALILVSTSLLSFAAEPQQITKLPAFTLTMADGSQIKTDDLIGKPYILHFWTTWCPYCKKLQPGLDKIHQQYKQYGLQVIAVSFREDEDANPAQSLIERGHNFKTAIKADAIATQLGIRGTPTTLFINRQGQLSWATTTSDPNDPSLLEHAAKLATSE
ncbi:TlpA family protein disulfide reductase [Pseudoalteromonas sp. SG43-6]|uniref:TlpA disulfide reductase family protein n=1 Tax=Pseudoalteromonas sp. SG43-6 TaxID=2760967 RepID=UPI001600961F|nr:TlpA disulfide reductase family protein [Pseudoalteromonas sp. SG43-6]MBB1435228.1 TlpA family protein disulfide reductase [Pseudoalteromonas sp. SG43-6]